MADDGKDALITVYQELCSSFRATDDFRAKLLGFLPLVSGAGIFLLLRPGFSDKTALFLLPIGLFGVGATLGLFVLELRGIQKCHAYIRAGQKVEKWSLGAEAHFARVPDELPISPFKLFRKSEDRKDPSKASATMGTFMAARLIYTTVFAGWMFVALLGLSEILCSTIGRGVGFPCALLSVQVALVVVVTLLLFVAFFLISGRYVGAIRRQIQEGEASKELTPEERHR